MIDIVQLYEYENFKDLGKDSSAPVRYNKIQFHIVYDVKHDRLHKVILGSDVHLTDILVEIVYSGFFFLCDIQLLVFLYQLNKMEIWDTYIGNAYIEAYTLEKNLHNIRDWIWL